MAVKIVDLGKVIGPSGANGKSAYQLAVEGGYTGTEAEFNAVLAAAPGHIGARNNPHGVTAAQVGADPAGSAAGVQNSLNAHAGNRSNPHGVTAAQVGADPAGSAAGVQNSLNAHAGRRDNPHGVTAAQVGAPTVGEFNALKTSVSEGKAQIAAAVTDKGVPTAADAAFSTMAANIRGIATGGVMHHNAIHRETIQGTDTFVVKLYASQIYCPANTVFFMLRTYWNIKDQTIDQTVDIDSMLPTFLFFRNPDGSWIIFRIYFSRADGTNILLETGQKPGNNLPDYQPKVAFVNGQWLFSIDNEHRVEERYLIGGTAYLYTQYFYA